MSSFAITWSPIVFGFALFLNSALLYLIQPMLGRTMEPLLGGNALAWKTCLVFFQSALFAGYVYADLIHRARGLRWQPWLQMGLMAFAIALCFGGLFGDRALLRFAPRLNSLETWPILSMLCLLIVVIGLPYFVLSAVGPLVLRWFAHLDHPKASDPYYLFIASNLGGLAGLIVYVLMIEPNAPLSAQWLAWKLAFAALTAMVGLVALCAWRSPRNPELEPPEKPSDPNMPVVAQLIGRGPATWPRRLYWFGAAAIPVALLMGLTDYLTLDLAPTPILWAVPIAIYLFAFSQAFSRFSIFAKGSFIVKLIMQLLYGICLCAALACLLVSLLNFDHPGDPAKGTLTTLCVITFAMILLAPSPWVYVLQPFSAIAIVFLQANVFKLDGVFMPTVLLYLVCYYLSIRLCLNILANDRPVASAVTTYYAWIGLGGLGGGLFQLFLAPLLFRTDYLEFAFIAALACMLRPAWLPNGLADWLTYSPFLPKQDPQAARARIALAFDLAFLVVATIGVALLLLLRTYVPEFVPRPNEHFAAAALRRLLSDFPLVLALLLTTLLIARPIRFGLALAGLIAVCWIGQHHDPHETLLVHERTPYGIVHVVERTKPLVMPREGGREYTERALLQGTMLQGSCIIDPPTLLRHPTAYYHRKGPVGQIMRNLEWFGVSKGDRNNQQPPEFWLKENRDNAKDDVRIIASMIGMAANGGVDAIAAAWSEPPYAFVGLGAGSLFAYAHPYQWVDAYELDPAILTLSEGEQPTFHYYHSAQQRGVCASLRAGDGRRLLTKAGHEAFYHALFVDAFTSNAIPTHLLTKQAIETYFHKLVPDGVVCVHTSNRNVELAKVLEQIARRLDIAMTKLHANVNDIDSPSFVASEWVVLARNKEVLRKWDEVGGFGQKAIPQPFGPRGFPGFMNQQRTMNRLLWTDEHASLFAAVRAGQPLPAFVYGLLGLLLGFAAIMAVVEMIASSATPARKKPV